MPARRWRRSGSRRWRRRQPDSMKPRCGCSSACAKDIFTVTSPGPACSQGRGSTSIGPGRYQRVGVRGSAEDQLVRVRHRLRRGGGEEVARTSRDRRCSRRARRRRSGRSRAVQALPRRTRRRTAGRAKSLPIGDRVRWPLALRRSPGCSMPTRPAWSAAGRVHRNGIWSSCGLAPKRVQQFLQRRQVAVVPKRCRRRRSSGVARSRSESLSSKQARATRLSSEPRSPPSDLRFDQPGSSGQVALRPRAAPLERS